MAGPDTPPVPPEPGDDDGPALMRDVPQTLVWCPECHNHIVIEDMHAFLLGLHQRVCVELMHVNGEP
jgi:hypothetical protein